MAFTIQSNLITPEVFLPYVAERTAALSEFITSGIVTDASAFMTQKMSGGETINLPTFNDISGRAEDMVEGTKVTINNLTAFDEKAVIFAKQKSWGTTALARFYSGSDPLRHVVEMLASFWARELQSTLLKTLEGALGAASMSDKVLDISAETTTAKNSISKDTFIDALQLMGDAANRISAVSMHSAVYAYLKKKEIANTILPSQDPGFPTYQGKRVVIDDSLPVASGVYTTYLFGEGAVAYAEVPSDMILIESARQTEENQDYIVSRKLFVMHPRGLKWKGTVKPTDAAVSTATNWERVFETKNIKIVQFKHKIA